MILTTISTAAGFLSLLATDIRPICQLGTFVAVGIVFAGVSSGINVVAALQLARELGPGKIVATVAVDTRLKYLRGELFG